MTKDESIADWQRMYEELTSPEKREEAKRQAERTASRNERMSDTGAYVT